MRFAEDREEAEEPEKNTRIPKKHRIETIASDELVRSIIKVYWSKSNKKVVAKVNLVYKSRSRL